MKKSTASDDEEDYDLDYLQPSKDKKAEEPSETSTIPGNKLNNVPQTNTPKSNVAPSGNAVLPQKESSKNPHLTPQGHGHEEGEELGDCDRCKRIQLQNEEQLKVLDRLTQNNEDLKVKIEALSQILQEKMEAMKQKKTPKKREKTVDPLKKELDEVHKKLLAAQKQAKIISDRLHNNVNFERITEMKNELIEKQNAISDLQKENKLLEDVTAYNQNVISEREAEQDTKQLDEEAAGIRNMLKEIKKDDRNLDKEMIRYCQHIVALETRHKEICEKFGVPSTFTPSRFEDMAEIIAENHKAKQLKKDKEEKEYQKKLGNVEINEETYKKFLADVKLKKQEKQEIELNQKKELEDITARIKQVNSDRDQLLLKLRDKEKELNISVMKINELKRLTKHNALTPIGSEFAKGTKTSSRRSEVRREQKGVSVGGESACSWDNSSELPETKDYSISQITVLYKEEQIKGMSIEYKHRGGDKSIIECFQPQSTEGLEERSLKLLGTEYITTVTGYYNNLFIEYLRIVTSRGNYIMAGSDKNQAKCKRIEFDIKKDEKPISFFGVVDRISLKKRSQAQTNEQATPSSSQINILEDDMILTNIGLELGKRENIGVLRSSALMSNCVQGPVKDEDEEELYGDQSKINKSKGGKRKLIDAANRRNLNLEDLADSSNMNDGFKASGVQEEKGTGRDYSPPQESQQQQSKSTPIKK